MNRPPLIHWHATIWYRTGTGLLGVIHDLSEVDDLHGLVENGPHWDEIDHIEVRRTTAHRNLTAEAVAPL